MRHEPILPLGIKDPIGGWGFFKAHEHDIIPCKIELIGPGSHQTINIKSREAEKEIIKIMREGKR